MLFFFEGGGSLSPRLGACVVPLFRALSGAFFKIIFKKVFIEFVSILLLFSVLSFWQ